MKNTNIIQTAINWTSLTVEKSKNFNDYKFINVSDTEPLKIEYIKKDKIEGLKSHQDIIFNNTKKQKKYLDNTSIIKLLNNMFKASTLEQTKTLNEVGETITKQLICESVKDITFFVEKDVAAFYAQEEGYKYNVLKNGSCMEGKDKSYFEIYQKFINIDTFIVGLRNKKNVIARAIFWRKETADKRERKYFLDKIYICSQYDNSIKIDLQSKLWAKTKRAFKINVLSCSNAFQIKDYYKSLFANDLVNKNLMAACKYSIPEFEIQITQDNFESLENYPYIDTFRFFKYTANNLKSCDEGESEIQLDLTDGHYNENSNRLFCEHLQEYIDEDEACFSEVDGCHYHQDYVIWIDERDDYVYQDDAVYNSHSGHYHYHGDLDI